MTSAPQQEAILTQMDASKNWISKLAAQAASHLDFRAVHAFVVAASVEVLPALKVVLAVVVVAEAAKEMASCCWHPRCWHPRCWSWCCGTFLESASTMVMAPAVTTMAWPSVRLLNVLLLLLLLKVLATLLLGQLVLQLLLLAAILLLEQLLLLLLRVLGNLLLGQLLL